MDSIDYITELENAIDSVISSKFILAEGAINKLLTFIASNKEVYSVIVDATKAQSYDDLYKESINDIGIVLPKSRRQIIALVTGLLYEFDDKRVPITEFITKYYKADTGNESYAMFGADILMPYKEAFLYLLKNNEEEAKDDFSLSLEPIPLNLKEESSFWLNALLDITYGDNSITNEERNDYVMLIKGLIHVIDMENAVLVRIVWVGIKNTLKYYKKGLREIKELESLLKSSGIIEG